MLITDNVSDVIKSPVLAAMATADVWEDRLLGRNRILHLPVRTVVIFTGNNIRLGGDMPRRCYYIKIDANAAQPWTRDGFKHRLPEYAVENRGTIVAALLTMARAWIEAGKPQGGNPTLGSFEKWCEVVGGILQYAGLNGFLGNLEEMRRSTADDEDDAEAWAAWMSVIYTRFGEEAFTVSQLAEAMHNINWTTLLKETAPYSLGEIGLSGDRSLLTRLGKGLHAHAGQVFDVDEETIKLFSFSD